jgi:cell wall-associated NlpC family hydrolase
LHPARTSLRALVFAVLAAAITGTTATAAHAAPSTGDLNKKITKAQSDLEDITESYNKMNISLKQTKDEEKKLAASLGPAKAARDAASAQVGTIAASTYKAGQIGTANILLDGPNDLLQQMSFADQMSRSRQRDIDVYTATTRDYTQRQAALQTTQEKQAAQVKEIAARKKKIESDLTSLYAMRTVAYGRAQDTGRSYSGAIPSVAGSAGTAVRYAFNAIGKPYVFGAAGPNSYDCSGLTSAAWAAAGRSLPHNAAAQFSATSRISRSALQPGDLVFYRALEHVGIYVGGGQIIDAPHAGATVNKRTIDIMPPYAFGRVH